MFSFNNLKDSIKLILISRIAYILILLSINIYCSIIINKESYSLFTLSVLISNCLLLLNSLYHIHNMIVNNITFTLNIITVDVSANFLIFIFLITYVIDLMIMKKEILIYEFSLFVIYILMIIIFIILPLILSLIGFFIYKIILLINKKEENSLELEIL